MTVVRIHTVKACTDIILADTFPCTQEQTTSRDESVAVMQSLPQKNGAAEQSPPQEPHVS